MTVGKSRQWWGRQRGTGPRVGRARRKTQRQRSLLTEMLEDRRMLATFTVTSLADGPVMMAGDQPGTLRQAIYDANAAPAEDEIVFEVDGSILLTEGELVVTEGLTLLGPGQEMLTIDGQTNSRLFSITADVETTFVGMTLTGGAAGDAEDGGAIRSAGPVSISHVAITSNQADDGGAIWTPTDRVTAEDSVISGNTATGMGGGIYAFDVELSDSTVADNTAGGRGGGIHSRQAVGLTSSTVSGNSTGDKGGGIFAGPLVELTNSTISGNSATDDGGGIYLLGLSAGSDINVTQGTIYGNTADGSGGGIAHSGEANITIHNAIVAGNTAATSGPDFVAPTTGTVTVLASLIGDNSDTLLDEAQTPDANGNLVGSATMPIDPQLEALADNGGLTPTHALLAASPAIDAGRIGLSTSDFDQRGVPFLRRVDGNSDGVAQPDMGAVEQQSFGSADFVVTTLIDELDGDRTADDVSLREAIAVANANPGTDVITFSEAISVNRGTIALMLGELAITESISIVGPAQQLLSIAAAGSRIFNMTDAAGSFDVSNLTLTGGEALTGAGRGGAILNAGELTLNSVVIADSRALTGGGVYSVGDLNLLGSIIRGNEASNDVDMVISQGGGIFAEGSLHVEASTISHNTAEHGGGIFTNAVNIMDSTVSGNTASMSGGGAYVTASLSAINSTFSGNRATSGGGLYTADGSLTLASSTVTLNSSQKDSLGMGGTGGGIGLETASAGESLTIDNSIIAGNTAATNPDFTAPLEAADLSVSHSLIGDNQGTTLDESQTADALGNLVGSSAGGGVIDAGLAPLANTGGRTATHALLTTSPAIDAGGTVDGSPMFDQRSAPFLRVFDGDGSGTAQTDMGAFELQTIVPGDLVVSTVLDESDGDLSPGDLSLREAIGLANASAAAETIMFDPILFAAPQTIYLSLGELDITNSLSLTGIRQGVLTIDAQEASRVIDISAAAVDVTISGMTLTGGRVEGDNATFRDTTYKGGAIRALNTGDLTLSDVAVTNSQTDGAFGDGGGIFALHDVYLTNSRVTGNRAQGVRPFGGGIYSYGQVVVSHSTISDNVAEGMSAKGGGIYARRDVELVSTTVSGNSADDNGGGIFAMRDVTLDNATISGNSSSASGGGIYSVDGTVTVQSSTIYENSAAELGGGIAFYANGNGEAS